MSNDVEVRFLQDTKNHELVYLKEDGVHRNMRLRNPKTSEYWFDLITWPGVLCINGDCGTYVFSRTHDMFEFFSSGISKSGKRSINSRYWSEKVLSEDQGGGIKKYSEDKFKALVKELYDDWCAEGIEEAEELRKEYAEEAPPAHEATKLAHDAEERYSLWKALEEEVMSDTQFEHECRVLADRFSHPSGFSFHDFWEYDLTEYTHRFQWCLHAILLGIQMYQKATFVGPLQEQPCQS